MHNVPHPTRKDATALKEGSRKGAPVAVSAHARHARRVHIPVSPHLLDLKAATAKTPAKPEPVPSAPRGFIGRLRHMLDEKIHLHDLRMRTLSIRPRGWKDFPPAGATTMWQAVRITASRFFNEHPLAELTVLSVLHIAALAVWHMALMPGRWISSLAARSQEDETPMPQVVSFLPLLAVPETADAAAEPARAPFRVFRLEWQAGWQRGVLGFAAVALLVVVPLGVYGSAGGFAGASKEHIMTEAVDAVAFLKAAGDQAKTKDFAAAAESFAQAKQDFADAKHDLGPLAAMLNTAATLLPGTPYTAAGPLLNAGREIADGGVTLTAGLAALQSSEDPAVKIRAAREALQQALPHLQYADRELQKVAPSGVPDAYRDQIAAVKAGFPDLVAAVQKATAVADVLGPLAGADAPKRYLVIFENNAELRPTGGFMGSFALVDVDKGKVEKMSIPGGGTYDLKGSLALTLSSPQPLHLINARWQFQDANWYPDFPTSAKQIRTFYDKAGGPTIDGVIAVTASFMEKLLAVTGPVDMPEYGKTITAQNFFYETQKQVEVDYDKQENKPKQFIADLAPKVLDRVMHASQDSAVKLASLLDESMTTKDIQLWMRDPSLQEKLSALGWTGEMKPSAGDYLYVVDTNIAGQKSDLMMQEDVAHDVKVLPDGTGIVTLTVTRTHTGQKDAMFTGVRNVDYMRVYAPKGSVLVEARGFEQPDPKLFKLGDPADGEDPTIAAEERGAHIDRDSGTLVSEEGDRTVFGNWVQTDPGRSTVVTLVYQLPPGTIDVQHPADGGIAKLVGSLSGDDHDRLGYSLLVQKQAGANPVHFTSSVDLPRGFYPSWQQPARAEDDRGRWTASSVVDRDSFFGTVAESR